MYIYLQFTYSQKVYNKSSIGSSNQWNWIFVCKLWANSNSKETTERIGKAGGCRIVTVCRGTRAKTMNMYVCFGNKRTRGYQSETVSADDWEEEEMKKN